MFLGSEEHFDHIGKFVLRSVYPHEHNNHRPWAIQIQGLIIFLVLILFSHVVLNLSSDSGKVLGFATNISDTEIINLTNLERNTQGLLALKPNSSLEKAAQFKAKDMIEDDYWAHFAPDGTSPWYWFGLVGYKYAWAGENLARDFATSSGVVSAWMASTAGHRENILNTNFTEIGIGVKNGNFQGEDSTIVVQLFGKPVVLAASQTGSESSTVTNSQPAKVEAELNLPNSSEKIVVPENTQAETAGFGSTNQLEFPGASLYKNSTSSQKVTMSLLAIIATLFVFDSVVIYRKRHQRVGSHSLAHASMIFLLIIVSLMYGKGTIL